MYSTLCLPRSRCASCDGEATERLAAGVDDVPVGAHGAGFGEYRVSWLDSSSVSRASPALGVRERAASVLKQYRFAKQNGPADRDERPRLGRRAAYIMMSVPRSHRRDWISLARRGGSRGQALGFFGDRIAPPIPPDGPSALRSMNPSARHAAGLMRVNHCGEIAAQALYRARR